MACYRDSFTFFTVSESLDFTGKFCFRHLAGALAFLTEDFHGILQSLQENIAILSLLDHTYPFQDITQ
jgi:hypothetical protein